VSDASLSIFFLFPETRKKKEEKKEGGLSYFSTPRCCPSELIGDFIQRRKSSGRVLLIDEKSNVFAKNDATLFLSWVKMKNASRRSGFLKILSSFLFFFFELAYVRKRVIYVPFACPVELASWQPQPFCIIFFLLFFTCFEARSEACHPPKRIPLVE
jgi:hypothetical protein